MKIPGGDEAIIEPEKIREYLLSPTHPVGKFKAAFFVALGYSQSRWQELQRDLRQIASLDGATQLTGSAFGTKFELTAILTGPSGRTAGVVTVWMVRHGEMVPRLITAYPGEPS